MTGLGTADDRPIFVVGASRSGTTLMREILNRFDHVWVASETHYFDDLRARLPKRARTTLERDEARLCEDYFLALSHRPYGRRGDPEASSRRVDRTELAVLARRIGNGADAYFEAHCRLLGNVNGRPPIGTVWGEKTPRHVYRIPEMVEAFSSARFVCMVRDPRAVVASYRYWKDSSEPRDVSRLDDAAFEEDELRARRSYNPVTIALLWRSAARAAAAAIRTLGPERVRLQRYEDLVLEPERELHALSDWLGFEYTDALLDVEALNSSFRMAESGISRESLERWRTKLAPRELAVIQQCCGGAMWELGYEPEPGSVSAIELALTWATVPVALGRALVVNRRRLGNPAAYVWTRLRLALGGGAG